MGQSKSNTLITVYSVICSRDLQEQPNQQATLRMAISGGLKNRPICSDSDCCLLRIYHTFLRVNLEQSQLLEQWFPGLTGFWMSDVLIISRWAELCAWVGNHQPDDLWPARSRGTPAWTMQWWFILILCCHSQVRSSGEIGLLSFQPCTQHTVKHKNKTEHPKCRQDERDCKKKHF